MYPLIYGASTIGRKNSALDRTSILFIKFQFYCDTLWYCKIGEFKPLHFINYQLFLTSEESSNT